MLVLYLFFLSSRRRHTRWPRDWSSDVCSSDLDLGAPLFGSIARMSVYLTSLIMVASVLAWIPNKRFSFTSLGARTLYVYLLHGFFIQFFRQWDLFQGEGLIDVLGLAFISLTIVFILSSRTVIMIWQPLIEGSASAIRHAMGTRRERSA